MRVLRSRGHSLMVALTCVTIALVFNGCEDDEIIAEPDVYPTEPYNTAKRAECPNVEEKVTGTTSQVTHTDTIHIQLAGPISHIPEYHDCQRLMVNGGSTYGPLVGVFARYQLENVQPEDYSKPTGTPSVELYNFHNVEYSALGIKPGFNCLYLKMTSTGWDARMLNMGSVNDCPLTISQMDWDTSKALVVTRTASPSDGLSAYPPVARWDWDEAASRHYIGVRCADGWCEVGAGHLTSSQTYGTLVTERIKGWYDEQWLALREPSGRLRPGPRARLIPAENLTQLDVPNFLCPDPCERTAGTWVHVATAILTGPGDTIYERKLNLRPGTPSLIFMRYRDLGDGRQEWHSKIVSGSTIAYKKVIRVPHPTINIPGTARWAWREDDEMAWVRCSLGCCSINGEDY